MIIVIRIVLKMLSGFITLPVVVIQFIIHVHIVLPMVALGLKKVVRLAILKEVHVNVEIVIHQTFTTLMPAATGTMEPPLPKVVQATLHLADQIQPHSQQTPQHQLLLPVLISQ